MYHWKDYLRFVYHLGKRYVFWCGSDILNLNKWNNWIFRFYKARHYCENEVEYLRLIANGIVSEVKPLFLGNIENFPISYKQFDRPQVWLCMHPGREEEYGLNIIFEIAPLLPEITFNIYGLSYDKIPEKYKQIRRPNIVNHGIVPEEQFNEEIKEYQCGLRLNSFDGFSEVVAKSILLGQYPISRIPHSYIDNFKTQDDLIFLLKQLKYKKEPNIDVRNHWLNKLR